MYAAAPDASYHKHAHMSTISDLRWIAITCYIPSVLTYIYAFVLLFGVNVFRDMVTHTLGPLGTRLIYACVFLGAQVTIVGMLSGPYWLDPDAAFMFAVCAYFVFTALWIPVIRSYMRSENSNVYLEHSTPRFPMDHFFTHRFVVVGAWVCSAYMGVHLWGVVPPALRVGIVFLCILTTFNALVFDVLYARWLMTPDDPNDTI